MITKMNIPSHSVSSHDTGGAQYSEAPWMVCKKINPMVIYKQINYYATELKAIRII
jgi:hypothetical protein